VLNKVRAGLCGVCMLLCGAASAQVFFERQGTYDENGKQFALLMVIGSIEIGEEKDLARHLATLKRERLRLVDDSVVLNSWGGNRAAAFKMGREIRKQGLATLVREDAQCESACVWLLVGGVCRAAMGFVGVHRVMHADPLDGPRLEALLASGGRDLKRYLAEMDVPAELAQVARHTPIWSVTYLSTVRKRVYGLFTTLPAEQERRIAAYVKRTGESKQEVLKKLKAREIALNTDLPEDVDYVPVPCSEQMLLVEPGSSLISAAPESASASRPTP